MFRTMMKSKIHRATVTEANLNYVGSITIDEDLMETSDLLENEKVQIVNNNNGARLETYVIPGPRGSGVICLNGAAYFVWCSLVIQSLLFPMLPCQMKRPKHTNQQWYLLMNIINQPKR